MTFYNVYITVIFSFFYIFFLFLSGKARLLSVRTWLKREVADRQSGAGDSVAAHSESSNSSELQELELAVQRSLRSIRNAMPQTPEPEDFPPHMIFFNKVVDAVLDQLSVSTPKN